jgi:transcriptional regulator with XRE-family HTH domain
MPPRTRPAPAFREWLNKTVAARGVSWRQFASDVGLKPSALSALHTGLAARPSIETCHRLALGTGVDLAYLLGLAGYSIDALGPARTADDPELEQMLTALHQLTPQELAPVKEFVRYTLVKRAARRPRRG